MFQHIVHCAAEQQFVIVKGRAPSFAQLGVIGGLKRRATLPANSATLRELPPAHLPTNHRKAWRSHDGVRREVLLKFVLQVYAYLR